jgi:hypothetical protein
MDTWKTSVLKNLALDYNVSCMGPVELGFPFPGVTMLSTEKTEIALGFLTR